MTRRRIRPLLPPAFAALIANGLPPATPATEEELLLLDVCALISTRIAEQNRVIEKLDAEVAQRAPLADLTPIQARAFNRARRRLANAFAKLDRLVRAQALILQIIDERHPPTKGSRTMTEPTKPSAPGPLLSIAREPGRTFFTDLNAMCKEYGIRTFSCALFDVTEGAHPFVDGCKLTAGPACTDDPGYHNSYFDSTESPVTYPDDPGTNARAVLAIDLYAPQDEEVS